MLRDFSFRSPITSKQNSTVDKLLTMGFVTFKTQKACRLPKDQTYTFWYITRPLRSGTFFSESGEIQIGCIEGYTLIGNNTISCINGHWNYEVGKCWRIFYKIVFELYLLKVF